MKFVLSATREVEWPVLIKVPVDGGTFQEHKITARFRLLNDQEQDELIKQHPNDPDMALLKVAVIGLKGVHDEGGKELPFSERLLADMLRWTFVRIAFVRAYNEARLGARAKN